MKPPTELSRRYKQIKLSPEQRKEVNRIWHEDKKRHAEFFGGISPQAEYDKHVEIRRKSDDY
jgi:hypothetical protein